MIRIGRLPGQYGTASLLGFAMGLVIFVVLSKVAIESPWPVAFRHYDQHLAGWISLRINTLIPDLFPDIARRYAAYLAALPAGTPAWHVTWRFDGALLLASVIGIWITWIVGRGIPDTRIIAGRRLYEGKAAHRELRERAQEDCAISGEGLKLHESFPWHLSRDRETRHFQILGSVGGGKTQAIKPILDAAIARGDKCIIYDCKGDFTSEMAVPFVLVTPWDQRSHAWDISKDCTTQQDARELAARLIPESQDPLWSKGAQQILSAIVQKLQNDFPENWTWRDFYKAVCLPQEALASIVAAYAPEARATETEGKTIDGILINLSTYMTIVADLSAAWGSAPPERRFSFSSWIHEPNPKQRVVILQGSGSYEILGKAYIQSIISMLSGQINSPKVFESKSRRIWFFLDEFPQIGRLEGFSSILEVGRSKGVCVVLGAQDLAQIEDLYGQYVAKTWGSLIGTQIVVRVNSGTTAQFISKELIGYATIERIQMHEGKPQPAATQQQLALEPSDISDHLGPNKRGVRAVLLGMGDAFIIEWPYTSSPKLREASIESSWVTAGVQSNKPRPPLPTTGAPPMPSTPVPTAQPAQATPSTGLPKLKLRTPTADEVLEMASTGTDIRFSPEPLNEMKTGADIVSGGAA
jgi:hypothetical protein